MLRKQILQEYFLSIVLFLHFFGRKPPQWCIQGSPNHPAPMASPQMSTISCNNSCFTMPRTTTSFLFSRQSQNASSILLAAQSFNQQQNVVTPMTAAHPPPTMTFQNYISPANKHTQQQLQHAAVFANATAKAAEELAKREQERHIINAFLREAGFYYSATSATSAPSTKPATENDTVSSMTMNFSPSSCPSPSPTTSTEESYYFPPPAAVGARTAMLLLNHLVVKSSVALSSAQNRRLLPSVEIFIRMGPMPKLLRL
jgi:hypothetical protein